LDPNCPPPTTKRGLGESAGNLSPSQPCTDDSHPCPTVAVLCLLVVHVFCLARFNPSVYVFVQNALADCGCGACVLLGPIQPFCVCLRTECAGRLWYAEVVYLIRFVGVHDGRCRRVSDARIYPNHNMCFIVGKHVPHLVNCGQYRLDIW